MGVDIAGQWYLFLIFGLTAGFLSALLGIGGGLVLVPLLVFAVAFPQKLAQGTSLGFMVGTALVGAIRYQTTGAADLNFWVIVLLTMGGIVGALVGSQVLAHIDNRWLARLFAILMVAVAVQMFLSTFKETKPKSSDSGPSAHSTRDVAPPGQ